MANYQSLKAAINAVIKANGKQEITGTVLNEVLLAMVNSLGSGYQFSGVATPSTNPGTPDQNVFYLAGQAGTYANFNSIVLPDGVSILKWNGSWSSETVLVSDGVFDISAYKATGGTLATFADLSAALDGGNNIPSALRKGGMSVKFVQSSDNSYVQFRYIGTETTGTPNPFLNTSNWLRIGADDSVTGTVGILQKMFDVTAGSSHLSNIDNIHTLVLKGSKYSFSLVSGTAELGSEPEIIPFVWDSNGNRIIISFGENIAETDLVMFGLHITGTGIVTSGTIGFSIKKEVNISVDKVNDSEYQFMYFGNGSRPTFSKTNNKVIIQFPTSQTATICSPFNDKIAISCTGQSFEIDGWKCLLYNKKSQTFSIHSYSELPLGSDEIILFIQCYGVIGGLLATYYNNQDYEKILSNLYKRAIFSTNVANRPLFRGKAAVGESLHIEIPTGNMTLCSDNEPTKVVAITNKIVADIPWYKMLIMNIETKETAVENSTTNISDNYVVLLNCNGDAVSGLLAPYYYAYYYGQNKEIPPYYDLFTAESAVLSHSTFGKNGEQFVFITDLHWANNEKHSPHLINHVIRNTPCSKVVMGGDYISSYAGKSAAVDSFNACIQSYVNNGYPCFPIYGNHDRNSIGTSASAQLSDDEVYSLMESKLPHYAKTENNLCYYFDNEQTNTRFILLKSASSGNLEGVPEDDIPAASITFVQNTLASTPANYKILIFVHAMGHDGGGDEISVVYSNGGATVKTMVDTHNANNTSKVIAIFTGHTHFDYDDKTTGGVPIIWTDTDSTRVIRTVATVGTVTEQCFDVVSIDYTEEKIYLDRIGRGQSRVITY